MKFQAPFSKWTALIAFAAVVAVLMINFGSARYQVARDYLLNSEDVREQYGQIRWYVVYAARSATSVSDGNYMSRGNFRFYVFGSADSGSVHVRVEDRDGKQTIFLE